MVDNYNRRIFKDFVKYLYFILFINFSFFLYIEMANNYNSKIFEGIFRDLFLFFFFYIEIRDNYDCRIFKSIFRDFVIRYFEFSSCFLLSLYV